MCSHIVWRVTIWALNGRSIGSAPARLPTRPSFHVERTGEKVFTPLDLDPAFALRFSEGNRNLVNRSWGRFELKRNFSDEPFGHRRLAPQTPAILSFDLWVNSERPRIFAGSPDPQRVRACLHDLSSEAEVGRRL